MMGRLLILLNILISLSWADMDTEGLLSRLYDWYKTNIVQTDGRVIDWQNNAVTHSEGIGYSLFFSVAMSDKETFYKIYRWFRKNIPLNENGLVPWLWGKNANGKWGILDFNDASDGNLWIAYSLLLGYEKWHDEELKKFALTLVKNIKKYDVFKRRKCLFLLPGSKFFVGSKTVTINPSYYAPFIFTKFYQYDKDPIWKALIKQSFKVWFYLSLTPYHLFPEWIDIGLKDCKISKIYGIMGFNAIRIPIWVLYSSDLPVELPLKKILIRKMFELSQQIKSNYKLICALSNLEDRVCKDFLSVSLAGYDPSLLEGIDWKRYKNNYYFLALSLFNLIFLNF